MKPETDGAGHPRRRVRIGTLAPEQHGVAERLHRLSPARRSGCLESRLLELAALAAPHHRACACGAVFSAA